MEYFDTNQICARKFAKKVFGISELISCIE